MTTTGSTEPAVEESAASHQTRRQKRIEEQRRKIEQLRREQHKKQLLWVGGVALAVAALIGAIVLLMRPGGGAAPAGESQGRHIPATQPASHIETGAPLQSATRPPSSGPHYERWSGYGFFEREVSAGNWVHNLEHGAIVVLYRPDLCDEACRTALRDVYNSAPRSRRHNNVKMVVAPYQEMDQAIAVVAWEWVDQMDQVDKGRILAFYRDHVDRGPEDVP